MDAERWRQIEDLYHSAIEREPGARDAFLAEACRGDEDLRQEVESRLDQQSGGLIGRPAWEAAIPLTDSIRTHLAAGTQLGPYQILGNLGAGGMGTVYRARDSRLGRSVAIKIIDQQFSDRFDREARAISTLNHPNICILYDVGPNYLVMEMVEGETLAARLRMGPLPVDLVVRYGLEVAGALDAAHARGIIHRDLKPAIYESACPVKRFFLSQFAFTAHTTTEILFRPVGRQAGGAAAVWLCLGR